MPTRTPTRGAKATTGKSTKAAEARAKREQLQERLEAYQQEGHDPEAVAFLMAVAAGYSERNSMLIAMQCPTATEVAGFHEWLRRDRSVRKGEHGIQILAPAGRTDDAPATPENPDGTPGRQLFRLAYVFDISQTDPTATPAE